MGIPMDDDDLGIDTEDVEVDGSDPITKFLEYIPLPRSKAKVSKEIDERKVTLYTPLLPDKIILKDSAWGRFQC